MNTIIVGNIGEVHKGSDDKEARKIYNQYVAQSKNGRGRAAGESVVWMQDNGRLVKEYNPDEIPD